MSSSSQGEAPKSSCVDHTARSMEITLPRCLARVAHLMTQDALSLQGAGRAPCARTSTPIFSWRVKSVVMSGLTQETKVRQPQVQPWPMLHFMTKLWSCTSGLLKHMQGSLKPQLGPAAVSPLAIRSCSRRRQAARGRAAALLPAP